MNISDWQHDQNRKEMARLTDLGFEIKVSSEGYTVKYQSEFIASSGVHVRSYYATTRRPWQHKKADLRDNLQLAIEQAKRSRHYALLAA